MKIAFFIVNMIVTLGTGTFLLMLYGRGGSVVHKWSFIGHWSLKLGLAMFTSGALLTALSLPEPNIIQLTRATGLALIFSWAVAFHYKYFIRGGKN